MALIQSSAVSKLKLEEVSIYVARADIHELSAFPHLQFTSFRPVYVALGNVRVNSNLTTRTAPRFSPKFSMTLNDSQ